MDIEFIAFAKWDFFPTSENEAVYETLEEIYEEEGEDYGGPTFGGGSWSQKVFGNSEDNPLEEDEDIQWIRTTVENNIRGILDIATLGLISQKKIDEILSEEETPYNEYNQFKKKFSELFTDVPSVVDNEHQRKAYLTYIEPDEEFELRTEGEIDPQRIQNIIQEYTGTLQRFEYLSGGYHTLYQGNYVVTQCVSSDPYSRLGVFTRGIDRAHNAPEELHTSPVWYDGIRGLMPYFRAYYWSGYRREQINEFDTQIDDNRDEWVASLNEERDSDWLLDTAREIHKMQLSWVDDFTRIVDELDHLEHTFRPRDGNEEANALRPKPVEIPPPDGHVIPTRPEGERDLVSIYHDDIINRLQLLGSELERVDEKVRKLSSNLHDVITVGSTEENIKLQNRIRKLTWGLFTLTIILVILTGAMVAIELNWF